MGTRCKYCEKPAKCSRRIKFTKDGQTLRADYNDVTFQSGDSDYEPVCNEEDLSCSNRPLGFVQPLLPTEIENG